MIHVKKTYLIKLRDDIFNCEDEKIHISIINDISKYKNFYNDKINKKYAHFIWDEISLKKSDIFLKLDEINFSLNNKDEETFIKVLLNEKLFWVSKTYFIYL